VVYPSDGYWSIQRDCITAKPPVYNVSLTKNALGEGNVKHFV
jgi:hypothetical protein